MSHLEARDRALWALYEAERRRLADVDLDPAHERLVGDELGFDDAASEAGSPAAEAHQKAVRLAEGVMANLAAIDAHILRLSTNWRPERMPPVDRAVLRLATYELLHEPATPPGVVLSEAARLAATYSTAKSAPFVNGVLAALADELAEDAPADR